MTGDFSFLYRREREFAYEHVQKSEHTGDHHHRKAVFYGVTDDYIPGQDDGEERTIRH